MNDDHKKFTEMHLKWKQSNNLSRPYHTIAPTGEKLELRMEKDRFVLLVDGQATGSLGLTGNVTTSDVRFLRPENWKMEPLEKDKFRRFAKSYARMKINWLPDPENEMLFHKDLSKNHKLSLRINYGEVLSRVPKEKRNMMDIPGFPDEPMYTFLVNGIELADLDDLPKNWNADKPRENSRGR